MQKKLMLLLQTEENALYWLVAKVQKRYAVCQILNCNIRNG